MIDRKKILIIAGIILLMVVINSQQQLADKKEANPFSMLSGGLAAVIIGGLLWATGTISGLAVAVVALIWGATRIGGGIWEWIHPSPAIPGWVWIAGFVVLAFWALKGRK